MPTIKEIAELAGVSRGTVDRVLNARGGVNEETAARIKEIIKALDYSPNLAGKSLAVKKKHLKFGFILFASTASNPFFSEVVKGIEDRVELLKDYGAAVEIRFAEIDNPDLQAKLIDELIESKIDGLAITPINHPLIAKKLKKLAKKGFPIVTVNSDIPDCGRIAYVGSEYYKSGETAAGLMKLISHGETNVGIVIGSPWVLCHSERVAGFTAHLANDSAISIVDTVVNNDDDAESYLVTKKLLDDNPDINALFLAAAGVGGACKAVLECAHRKIKIISYDAIASTCRLVREGVIAFTIAQEPFVQGTKPLDILLDYVGMGISPESDCFYTKIDIKIKENLN